MQLMVDTFGAFVGKHSERIVIRTKSDERTEVPLMDVEHVLIVANGVTLSSDVVRSCVERGIPISFISHGGDLYATVISPELVGTVRTRREQLLAYSDERGVELARAFALGKLQNQANLLRYVAKYRKTQDRDVYERVRQAADEILQLAENIKGLKAQNVDEARGPLMNREAQAAKLYWQAVGELITADVEWPGRQGRGAEDVVNSCLNYGYGILYSQVQQAVILAGLDPYAGFTHADRSGKYSLVLDLVEEFRQPLVDRSVLALLNKGYVPKIEAGQLDEAGRRTLAKRVLERLEAEETHEGKKRKLRAVLQRQAQRVAAHVRGEAKYKPYVMAW